MGLSLSVATEGNFRISLMKDAHTFMGTQGLTSKAMSLCQLEYV